MLNADQANNIEYSIIQFIDYRNNDKDLHLEVLPLSWIVKLMERFNYRETKFETIGQKCNFSVTFQAPKKPTLVLTGSLYYGNYYLSKQ